MNRDIDRIVRKKLEGIEDTYPADMWSRIDREINPPLKKNRWLFFGLSGLALIALVSTGLFYMMQSNKGASVLSAHQQMDGTSMTNQHTALQPADTNTSNNTNNNSQLGINEVSNTTDASSREDSGTSQLDKELVNPTVTQHTAGTESKVSFDESRKTNKAKTQNENRQANLNNKLIPVSDRQNKPMAVVNQALSRKSITFIEPLLVGASGKKKTAKGIVNSRLLETSSLNPLASQELLQTAHSAPELVLVPRALKFSTDCPSWVTEKLGFYVESYFAPEYAIRALTAKNTDPETITHQNQRNETETGLVSYSLGVRGMFLTPSGISFKAGINYSQINERFSFFDPEASKEITVTDPQTGEILEQYTQYGEERVEKINRYKSIDIPILIGFEKYQGNKFSISANAGAYFNFFAQQRGMFITPGGDYKWFTSGEEDAYRAYKDGLGISFYGSLGLMYHWVDGMDFFAEPSLRYYATSFTLENYPLKQNFVVFGLTTGARLRF